MKTSLIIFFFVALLKCQVKTGLDVLIDDNFKILNNKKVALITNQTGVTKDLIQNIDVIKSANNLSLEFVFAPEHGLSGAINAGDFVDNYFDEKYNLMIYSLYGKNKIPSDDLLKKVDVIVFDMQDIGCRSYTYISTLGLAMEAAAKNNIEFIVLDRPNPFGGLRIEGNILESETKSFIGQFEIPYLYGLTIGELAKYINNEVNKVKCKLTIVKMKNWKRIMLFDDTGLEWIPTSPHIPYSFSPSYYVATGIVGELNSFNIGVGFTLPFNIISCTSVDFDKVLISLNKRDLKNIKFRKIDYIPYYGSQKNKKLSGIQIYFENPKFIKSFIEIQFVVLEAIYNSVSENVWLELLNTNTSMFEKAVGSKNIFNFLKNGNFYEIYKYLNKDINKFLTKSKKYYIYD